MKTAPLTDRIRLERRYETTDDGAGNRLTEWRHVGDFRAQIRELRGDETVQAAKLQGRGTCLVILRSSTVTRSITTDDRIIDLSCDRSLNVRHAPPPGRSGYITLLCEDGVADG